MSEFLIQRSATIPAPIETVRSFIRDLHRWEQWSPWQELDPQMKQQYSGPDAGVGASMEWKGNRKAGAGKMTVVIDVPECVEVDLEFLQPFTARHRSRFDLHAQNDHSTVVSWTMAGEQYPMMRWLFTLMRMDKAIGRDFERGLTRLSQAVQR